MKNKFDKDKLSKALINFTYRHDKSVDASKFNDPVALRTDWTPTRSGNASYRTHKLVVKTPEQLKFKATLDAQFFYLIIFLFGAGFLYLVVHEMVTPEGLEFSINKIIGALIAITFMSLGGGLFYFGTLPIVFDKQKGFFWKGRKAPDEVFDTQTLNDYAALEDIYALQIIAEFSPGDRGVRKSRVDYSYELTLVLKNGSRISFFNHKKEKFLREDAETISRFLEKPIWDAT